MIGEKKEQNSVNFKDLARNLKNWGLVSSNARGVAMIRIVLAAILEELNKGNRVKLCRFGSFVPRLRPGMVREIQGEVQEIDDRHFITFKSSAAVKRFVNGESVNPILEDLEN